MLAETRWRVLNTWRTGSRKNCRVGNRNVYLKQGKKFFSMRWLRRSRHTLWLVLTWQRLCDSISQMICRYWWAQNDKDRSMHWVSWEKMMKHKEDGRLGFRDLHLFNLSMLAKQVWRLIQAPESLCAWVLRAVYFPDGDILNATPTKGCSYVWRSIIQGATVFKKGYISRVGDGTHIKVWEHPWLPRGTTRRPSTPQGSSQIIWVAELIDQVTGCWDE